MNTENMNVTISLETAKLAYGVLAINWEYLADENSEKIVKNSETADKYKSALKELKLVGADDGYSYPRIDEID